MTTYTVYRPDDSSDAETGLTAIDAMDRILSHDGFAYEVRPMDGGGFALWHSDGSANSPRGARHMVKTVAFSLATNRATAEQEIAERVIKARWPRLPEAMPDADFAAMMAQIAADA